MGSEEKGMGEVGRHLNLWVEGAEMKNGLWIMEGGRVEGREGRGEDEKRRCELEDWIKIERERERERVESKERAVRIRMHRQLGWGWFGSRQAKRRVVG